MITAATITAFFLLFGLIATRKINFGSHSWLKLAGTLTYPLYLMHSDMAFIAFHHLQGPVNKYEVV